MDNEHFMMELQESFNRSKRLLMRKKDEYNVIRKNRLEQFYRAAEVQAINPCEALIGMATKHFTSICDMCKNPLAYSIPKWNEKLTDLRNYTFLLDALVRDLENNYE